MGAYNQLIFLFEGVLNEIQNGEKCPCYTKLLEKSNENDVFITFNWDTLLDRVLWKSKLWSPEDNYGITFTSFYNNEWQDTLGFGKSKVKLLKLHGSTNWIIPYFGYNFTNLQKHRDFVYYKQRNNTSSASDSNLQNKLARASFKITELMDIAELFRYELKFVPKKLIEAHENNNKHV